MDPLRIEATVDTPAVLFDRNAGVFEISGKSYPEDTREFYGEILAWLDLYVADPNPNTLFVFKLKYFNSSSYKPVFDLISKLDTLPKKNKTVVVQWHYKNGDTDMQEAGEEFADLVSIPFTYHSF
mgnify:CR=1 FL=1